MKTRSWHTSMARRRRRARRSRRFGTMLMSVVVLGASQALLLPVAGAQQAKAPAIPAPLPATPAPPAKVEHPAGDLVGAPPHPADRSANAPATRNSFDPARSKVLGAETTPTKLVYANPDGSHTAFISEAPVRFKDLGGAWRDLDLSLAPSAGGFTAKAAPNAATVATLAQGAVASVTTPAGTLVARHPDALPVAGVSTKDGASYAKALPGGRDLVVRPLSGGFSESVILPDAKASSSYRVELVLPAGVTAAQSGGDVELRDSSGAALGRFGSALAFDAAAAKGGVLTTAPVTVRLVGQDAGVAAVDVAVDPAWLSAPGRQFPVTIDPTFSQLSTNAGAFDTWVYSAEYANTSYSSQAWLVVGSLDAGVHTARSFLRFDTSSLPTGPNVTVLAPTCLSTSGMRARARRRTSTSRGWRRIPARRRRGPTSRSPTPPAWCPSGRSTTATPPVRVSPSASTPPAWPGAGLPTAPPITAWP
jgi:hypothetical protein